MEPSGIKGSQVAFNSQTLHYLERVLRLGTGDRITVSDGSREYAAELIRDFRGRLQARIQESPERSDSNMPDIVLGFGCVRPGPFEEILRHCTELGVTIFAPLITERVVRRPETKKDRWTAVVVSAAQQCGRVHLPEVYPPADLKAFIYERSSEDLKIVCSQGSSSKPLSKVTSISGISSVVLIVGPEGGLVESEEELLIAEGYLPVRLSSRALRTETAAILATGIASALWAPDLPGPE